VEEFLTTGRTDKESIFKVFSKKKQRFQRKRKGPRLWERGIICTGGGSHKDKKRKMKPPVLPNIVKKGGTGHTSTALPQKKKRYRSKKSPSA